MCSVHRSSIKSESILHIQQQPLKCQVTLRLKITLCCIDPSFEKNLLTQHNEKHDTSQKLDWIALQHERSGIQSSSRYANMKHSPYTGVKDKRRTSAFSPKMKSDIGRPANGAEKQSLHEAWEPSADTNIQSCVTSDNRARGGAEHFSLTTTFPRRKENRGNQSSDFNIQSPEAFRKNVTVGDEFAQWQQPRLKVGIKTQEHVKKKKTLTMRKEL